MNRLKKLSSILLIIAVLVLMSACGGAASDTADKTGIIGAMDEEVASLKSAMKFSATTTIAGMEFCEGTLDGKSVVVVQCGIGKVNAGICAHTRWCMPIVVKPPLCA